MMILRAYWRKKMYLIIGRDNCTFCDKAKAHMERNSLKYIYKNISKMDDIEYKFYVDLVKEDIGMRTLPVIFNLIGGYDQLINGKNNE
jgi:glutaredoxin